jgi:chromosome segregation ATPase
MSDAPAILQRVKSAHERTAVRRLSEARAALARVCQQRQAKCRELEDYRAWRPPHERGLYQAIEKHQVTLADLEEMNAEIAKLRAHEESLAEEVADLERSVEEAGQAEQEAHTTWQAAQREVEKAGELVADWRQRERQQVERQAELELEEFNRRAGAPLDRRKGS